MIHPLGTLLEDTFKIFRERWKAFLVIGIMTGITSAALNGVVVLLDAIPDEESTQADWTEYEEWDESYGEYDYEEEWADEEMTDEELALWEEEYWDEEDADLEEGVIYEDGVPADESLEEEVMMTEEEEIDWSDPAVIFGVGMFIFGGISFFLFFVWISVWFQTAAMLLSFPKKIPLGKALRDGARLSFPVLGVVFFLFVYSGVWLVLPAIFLPFPVGIIAVLAILAWAIAVGPRLSIAPSVYLAEQKGVHAAVKKTWDVTRGRWLKIVGNMLAIGFITGGIAMALMIVGALVILPILFLVFVSPYILVIAVILGVVFFIMLTSLLPMLQQIFLVQLSLTLLKNPKHPVKK